MKPQVEPIVRDGMTLTQIYNNRIACYERDIGLRWVWRDGDLRLEPAPQSRY